MKFARTLLMCAVASATVALPAFSAEQMGSINNEEDVNVESDLLAFLPGSAETMAVLPAAPTSDEATVGAGMHGEEGGGWHHHGGPGGGHGHRGILSSLEGPLAVTDDQFEKLYSLRNQYLDEIAPKTMQIGQLSRKMRDALASANLDSKAVTDYGTQINGLKSEIAAAKLRRTVASAQVLTADQRKALHDKMIRHAVEGGMHGHHHH